MPSNKKIYEKPLVVSFGKVANTLGQQVSPMAICAIGQSPSGTGIICDPGTTPDPSATCDDGVLVGPDYPLCQPGDSAASSCQTGGLAGACNNGTIDT